MTEARDVRKYVPILPGINSVCWMTAAAITSHAHWLSVTCYVFATVSALATLAYAWALCKTTITPQGTETTR